MSTSAYTKKRLSCEFLFSAYLWGFALLRPVVKFYADRSAAILALYLFLIVGLFFFDLTRQKRFQFNKAIYFILAATAILFLDLLFRKNSFSTQYFYEFLYGPFVSVLMLSQVTDIRRLIFFNALFSFVAFCLFCIDPFREYVIFGNYMGWGFDMAMPAFLGMYAGAKFLKMRWLFLFALACFAEGLIYANRSASLSMFIFIILVEVFTQGSWEIKKATKYVFFLILLSFVITHSATIINASYDFVKNLGYSSYALEKIIRVVNDQADSRFLSGRDEIWMMAREMIEERPLLGHGMGAFQSQYEIYSHSIYYDILIFYGYAGLIVFFLIFLKSLFKMIFVSDGGAKIFLILLFCLWCPKLFFSVYFIKDIAFWCYLSFAFVQKKNKSSSVVPVYSALSPQNGRTAR